MRALILLAVIVSSARLGGMDFVQQEVPTERA